MFLQTSSPSYLLMTSLDAARAHAQLPGTFQEPMEAAALARQRLRQLPGISLLHDSLTPGTSLHVTRQHVWSTTDPHMLLGPVVVHFTS